MSIRKTGYRIAVRYLASDGGEREDDFSAGSKAVASKRYRDFSERPGTLEAKLFYNGKLRLRTVRDCRGRMQPVEND